MGAQENKLIDSVKSSTDKKSLCLILQTDTLQFIVPRIQIAEVVRYDSISFSAPSKDGITFIGWRNAQVPLVSTDLINPSSTVTLAEDSKVIVLHGLLKNSELPYYALTVTSSPRLVEVYADTIVEDETVETSAPGEMLHVLLDGEAVVIPKFEYLEKSILDTLS